MAGGVKRPWKEEVRAIIKKKFQNAVKKKLVEAEKYNAEDRVRYKLVRWKLGKSGGIDMLPGRLAPRVLKRLRELGSVVAPRVVAACFGTLWNR